MDREQNTCRPTDDARTQCAAAQQVAAPHARALCHAAGLAINARRGFTLVELLVTIAIIAILAGIILVAVSGTASGESGQHTGPDRQAARPNDGALRVVSHPPAADQHRRPHGKQAALHRLNAVRELMRMELPDRYSDLMTVSTGVLPYSAIYCGARLHVRLVSPEMVGGTQSVATCASRRPL